MSKLVAYENDCLVMDDGERIPLPNGAVCEGPREMWIPGRYLFEVFAPQLSSVPFMFHTGYDGKAIKECLRSINVGIAQKDLPNLADLLFAS